MYNVVGLGAAGCKIANLFGRYPQYKIFSLDVEDDSYKNFKKVPSRDSHESYDSVTQNFGLSSLNGHSIFITCGGGKISGASLKVLEQLKNNPITLMYIKPDLDMLTESSLKQERVTRHVLQQYARSGLLQKIIMIDNCMMDKLVSEFSIRQYWGKINDLIVSTVHMINVFNNTKPEMTTFSAIPDTARIQTVGIVNLETAEESLFYGLQMPREKLYYYALSKKSLESESGLYKKITQQVKSKSKEKERTSFSIYQTEYEIDYVYTLQVATLIQDEIMA